MEGFTWVDGAVALVVIVSALLAYGRGFVREAFAIGGWIVAAIAAFAFAPALRPLMLDVPVIGDYLQDSCELAIVAAFAVVFAAALLIVGLFTPLLSSSIRDSALGTVDQMLGFLFGVARGVVLVAVALVAYDRISVGEGVDAVDGSRTAIAFQELNARIEENLPQEAPAWIRDRYETLVGACV